ncbi:MAG: hypothetical protein K0S07_1379, partial [Chlamydiales bacterium]|nr:hypothetical protein [Chlamydiales bacterium]
MLPPLKPSQKGTSVQHQEASPSKKGFARLFSIPRRRSSSDTAKSFEKSAEKSTEEKVERQVASLTLAASNSSEICVSRPNRAAKELRRRSLNLSCRLIHIQHFAKEHTLNDLYQLPLDTPIEVVSLIIAFGQGTLIRHLEKETDLGLKESGGMESLLSQRYDLTKDSEGIFNSENEKKGRSTLPQSTHALALYRATLAGLQFFVEPLQFFQLLSQAVDSPLLPMRNKRSLIRVALEWALLPGQEGLAEGSDLFLCLSKIAEKGMLEKCEPESSSLYQALLQRAASDSKRKKSLQFEESPLLTEGPILEKMEKGGDEQPRILAQKLRGTMAHFLALIPPSELWQKEGGFYLTQAAEYFNALTLYFVYQILASQNEIEACSTIYFIR